MKIKDYIIIILLLIAGHFYVTNKVINVVNEHKAAIISQDSILTSHSRLIPQLIQAVNAQAVTDEVHARTLLSAAPEELKVAQETTRKRLEEEVKKAATSNTPDTPNNDSK